MHNPILVAERRFGDTSQMVAALGDVALCMTGRDVAYVKTLTPEGEYASIIRLWSDKLTDGSIVYELHIL